MRYWAINEHTTIVAYYRRWTEREARAAYSRKYPMLTIVRSWEISEEQYLAGMEAIRTRSAIEPRRG